MNEATYLAMETIANVRPLQSLTQKASTPIELRDTTGDLIYRSRDLLGEDEKIAQHLRARVGHADYLEKVDWDLAWETLRED